MDFLEKEHYFQGTFRKNQTTQPQFEIIISKEKLMNDGVVFHKFHRII